jgi:hypothetical protein
MSSHAHHEAEILTRLIQPGESSIRPEVAEYLVALDFGSADVERMNLLAQKAVEDNLTVEEASELDGYRSVGHFLALVQSKARNSLKRSHEQRG